MNEYTLKTCMMLKSKVLAAASPPPTPLILKGYMILACIHLFFDIISKGIHALSMYTVHFGGGKFNDLWNN